VAPTTGRNPTPTDKGGGGGQRQGGPHEAGAGESADKIGHRLLGARKRWRRRHHQHSPTSNDNTEQRQGGEQQRIAAGRNEHATEDRAQGVAQAFPGAVTAEPLALPGIWGKPRDQHPGRRGERGSGGTLPEPREPDPGRVACSHERGGGGSERQQATQQHRAGANPVGQ
jgi:hypothetical protein